MFKAPIDPEIIVVGLGAGESSEDEAVGVA
jgi:hypothetical protein